MVLCEFLNGSFVSSVVECLFDVRSCLIELCCNLFSTLILSIERDLVINFFEFVVKKVFGLGKAGVLLNYY